MNEIPKTKIIVCPDCKGKGYKCMFTGDSDSEITCETCGGSRVVNEITTIKYEKVE